MPRERICEWQSSDATDASKSHDNDCICNTFGLHAYVEHIFFSGCYYLFKISTSREYAILDP